MLARSKKIHAGDIILNAASVRPSNNVARKRPSNKEPLSGSARNAAIKLLYPDNRRRARRVTPAQPRFK